MAYTFKYADGTTGDSPYQTGADGRVLTNEYGGVIRGEYLGSDGNAQGWLVGANTPSPSAGGGSIGGSGNAVFGGTSPGSINVGTGDNSYVGGSSGGGSGGSYYQQGTNPYLQQQADALTKDMTNNFNTRVLPGIGSQAMAAGGFGGSRQGVIEANANNDLQSQIASGLAGLRGNGFSTALQYDLGRRNNDLGFYNASNSYDLGRGNLGLGYAGLDRQINNDNNSWALQGAQLGNNTWNQLMGNNQTGLTAGTNIQNTPLNYLNNFGNLINGIGSGFGTTTGTGSTQGNPLLGAMGGMQLGGQIGNLWGSSGLKSGGGGIMDQLGGLGVF